MQDLPTSDNPIYQLLRDFAKLETKMDQVIKNQEVIHERITVAKSENDQLRQEMHEVHVQVTKIVRPYKI